MLLRRAAGDRVHRVDNPVLLRHTARERNKPDRRDEDIAKNPEPRSFQYSLALIRCWMQRGHTAGPARSVSRFELRALNKTGAEVTDSGRNFSFRAVFNRLIPSPSSRFPRETCGLAHCLCGALNGF